MLSKFRVVIVIIISALLVLLWSYTAFSKLFDIEEFKRQLNNQTLGKTAANFLVWFLPASEISVASLLLFSKTRFLAFIFSTLLMLVFTGYIALVLFGFYHRIPCSCGGVLKGLGWQMHLWFNLFFLVISCCGIYLELSNRNIKMLRS